MKTVRFSKIIEGSGKPETHLVLTDPKKDKELQAAVKADRVMTVFQGAVGNKMDRGEIGFELGRARQFLVFPKSLKKFKGKSVVGIKYDLIHSRDLPNPERAAPVQAPKRQNTKKQLQKRAPKKPASEKKIARKQEPKTLRKVVRAPAHKKDTNIVPFPARETSRDDASEEVTSLKNQVRRAMKSLEGGKQVAAFNLLKRIVDS